MTSKEICEVIGEVFGREFVLAKGCRMVISKRNLEPMSLWKIFS